MLRTLIPLANVTVPDRTAGQFWMTVLVLLLIAGAIVIFYRRNRFAHLSDEQRRQKSALLGSIHDQTPETVRIPASADVDEYREPLRAAFDRAFGRARGETDEHDPDRVTIREASTAVAGELYDAAGEHFPTIPRAARRVGTMAILVGVLGSLAVSTDAIVAALTRDSSGLPPVVELLGDAVSLTQSVIGSAVDLLMLFPGGAFLANFVFAYGMLAWTLAYQLWYVLMVGLVIGAVAITVLDRRVPDDLDTKLYQHRGTLTLETIGAVTSIWLVGVVPAGLGQLAGTATVGPLSLNVEAALTVVGVLFAFVLTGLFLYAAGRSLVERLRHAVTIDWSDGPDSIVAAYLLARYCAVGLALVAAPLVPVYAIVILVEGRLVEVVLAFWAANISTQLLVFAFVALCLGTVAYVARDSREDVEAALTETMARQSVRAAIFQRGVTIFAWLASYAVLWSFSRSIGLALVGSFVLAAVFYGLYDLTDRATYRLELFGRDRSAMKGLVVQAYAAEDADGELHPVAKIGDSHRISRESIGETVDDTLEVASNARVRTKTVPTTVGQKRAEDLLELGMVYGDVETELQEQIRKTIAYELRPTRRTTMESLENALEKHPESLWRAEFERYCALAVLSRDGDIVRLERDVWDGTGDSRSSTRWLTGARV
ncbi:hypothetical protein [Halomontanus rarus]|uniref:hypothetical protein n=1 Tax=Halomontanus rarus TaxID=3034020 RepID=UPI00307B8EA1